MIQAGIFDVGGVLIGNADIYDAKIQEDTMQTLDITKEIFNRYWDTVLIPFTKGEITEEEFWDKFISETNAPNDLPEKSLFLREFDKYFKPNHDVLELVHSLKENGYKLGTLSNTCKPHVTYLEENGIYDDFDVKVFSNEVGLLKPELEIYRLTLERLAVDPDKTFFVDDKETYVKGANDVGIHGILFENFEKLQIDLKKLGVKI